ncbi:roadblock/LC7 domain-containing protein [Streptomyces sp. NPDC091376]|uniref:roadblock/LC7 domain-containing protein n=1 Tax=Streptomyces sp. NPDC091376 TaxID=3365994 RepID=UPI00381BA895
MNGTNLSEGTARPPGAGEDGGLDWIVTRFTGLMAGIRSAAVVSSDGILLASSARIPGEAEQLAAVSSGIVALSGGGARMLGRGGVGRTVVEMANGTLVVMAISRGALLAVLMAPDCDLGLAGYHMARLAQQCGAVLTPAERGSTHTFGSVPPLPRGHEGLEAGP